MIVLVVEKVSPSLRGLLSRWLIEVKTGVFVGNLSALVRDLLWEKYLQDLAVGSALQIWTTNNEQGFDMRMAGDRDRIIADYDGLKLIKRKLSD